MPNANQHLGRTGEALAVRHLKKKGYRILEQNFRTPVGEIDVIARDRDVIVFVEVKTRATRRFGGAGHAVTRRKQRNISMAALTYLKKTGNTDTRARFDVVTIQHGEGAPVIEIIKNAFDLAYS